MKGAVLNKGEKRYTNLRKLFHAIKNVQRDYNWLITDCECCTRTDAFRERIFQYGDYGWVSGNELTDMIEAEDFQWIWGVLSGFERSISLKEILTYSMPYADMYKGFWVNPVSVQHPLAEIEIVPWDSSCTLIMSRHDRIVDDFTEGFPLCHDLALYNSCGGQPDETARLNQWLEENR